MLLGDRNAGRWTVAESCQLKRDDPIESSRDTLQMFLSKPKSNGRPTPIRETFPERSKTRPAPKKLRTVQFAWVRKHSVVA